MRANPLAGLPPLTEADLRFRSTFSAKDWLAEHPTTLPRAEVSPEQATEIGRAYLAIVTNKELVGICRARGIDVLDDPDRAAGSADQIQTLRTENAGLLERALTAERKLAELTVKTADAVPEGE